MKSLLVSTESRERFKGKKEVRKREIETFNQLVMFLKDNKDFQNNKNIESLGTSISK